MNAQERPTIQQLRNAYDAEMKNILTNKRVLANILVGCTDEFAHCDVEDVIAMSFNTTPTYGNTSVEEDTSTAELAAKLTGGEHATLTEGKVVYDTRFEVCVPNTNTTIELIVNVEGQRNSNLQYFLTRRGIYYAARLVTSQKGTVFKNDDYNAIKKVYSIWICTHPPEKARGTSQRFVISKEDFIGEYDVDPIQYDLMTVVLIWVGDSTDPNYNNKLMKMLSLFFRAEVPIEQSSLMLHTDYGFPPDVLSKEAHMKSWALDIENEGFQRGIKQGRGEGLELGIVQGLARTIKRMMAKMGSSLEDTMAYLQLTDDEKISVRACFNS